jgi:hypothetical protein
MMIVLNRFTNYLMRMERHSLPSEEDPKEESKVEKLFKQSNPQSEREISCHQVSMQYLQSKRA